MSSLQQGSGAGCAEEGGVPGRVAELPVAVGPDARGPRLLHSLYIRRPGKSLQLFCNCLVAWAWKKEQLQCTLYLSKGLEELRVTSRRGAPWVAQDAGTRNHSKPFLRFLKYTTKLFHHPRPISHSFSFSPFLSVCKNLTNCTPSTEQRARCEHGLRLHHPLQPAPSPLQPAAPGDQQGGAGMVDASNLEPNLLRLRTRYGPINATYFDIKSAAFA